MFTQLEFKDLNIGDEIRFGQLWDGEGDGEQIFQSGAYVYNENHIVEFRPYYRVSGYDLSDLQSLLGAMIVITDKTEYESEETE